MAYNIQHLSLPEIGEHANQPSGYNFLKQSFGKTKVVHRAFQQSRFGRWKWLHYDSSKDLSVFLPYLCKCPEDRSASALHRVKTYLRSAMTQSRFNHLLVLLCHKGRTDSLFLAKCLQQFVDYRERRIDVFGKFT